MARKKSKRPRIGIITQDEIERIQLEVSKELSAERRRLARRRKRK